MRPETFHDLASGRRRGLTAGLARAALSAVEIPYGWAVRRRNRRYDLRRAEILAADVPVISVGNVTLGGVGKTPAVAYVVRRLRSLGRRPAILSRGYGAKSGQPNDEARELELLVPGVPHVQHPDRVAGARIAVEKHGADVLVLDDGFQHRRLHRDLDVVLIDATSPDGYGRLFPRGALREPLSGLARADVVVLSRADQVSAARRAEIRNRLRPFHQRAAWVEAAHRPTHLRGVDGETFPLDRLAGVSTAAFCAIGNPAAFGRTLSDAGMSVVGRRSFPDHHAYAAADLAGAAAWAKSLGAEALLCTQKDLVKLADFSVDLPLFALAVEWRVDAAESDLLAAIDRLASESAARDVASQPAA